MDTSCSKSFLLNYYLHTLMLLSCFWSPQFSSVYWAMLLGIEYVSLNCISFVETNYFFFAASHDTSVCAAQSHIVLSVQHAIV